MEATTGRREPVSGPRAGRLRTTVEKLIAWLKDELLTSYPEDSPSAWDDLAGERKSSRPVQPEGEEFERMAA